MSSKARNQTFAWLQALLIIMVIDDHSSANIGILSSVFPYNSFYMPLFVFISGYFYKERRIADNSIHRLKRLLLPYVLWNVAGSGLAFLLHKLGIVNWYNPWNGRLLLVMLTKSPATSMIGPGWFVIMLFYVSIGYNIIDNLLARFRSMARDNVLLLLMCGVGIAALWLCIHYYQGGLLFIVPVRTVFYLQFYHMGHMFAKYWEQTVLRWKGSVVCGICIAINVVLLCFRRESVIFPATMDMGAFKSCWLPLLTSITGGLFWYEVAHVLAQKIGENRAVEFISEIPTRS